MNHSEADAAQEKGLVRHVPQPDECDCRDGVEEVLGSCKKDHSAAGSSNVTAGMIATLNHGDSQLIKRLVNLVLTP